VGYSIVVVTEKERKEGEEGSSPDSGEEGIIII